MTQTTCWTVIHGASEGRRGDRDAFVDVYGPVIHTYFDSRWARGPRASVVDDAVQQVFVECFKHGGALLSASDRRRANRLPSFRGFLHGVIRNVARRFEEPRGREVRADTLFDPVDDEPEAAAAFDRAWAQAILREAAGRHADRARIMGPEAERRVRLLDRHFNHGESIRDLATAWDLDLKFAHRQFARAREEFRESLQDVLRFHYPGDHPSTEREAADLLEALAR